jgi:hypothetical protein
MGVLSSISNAAGSIISSGITSSAGLASTIATNNANKDIAQMNNAFNEKMFDKQIDYNKEMYNTQLGDQWDFYNDAKQNAWDMFNATNEYNSASAQRERLEAAGLNPYLMMSGSSAGTASAVSSASGSAPSGQGVNPPTASSYTADYSGIADSIGHAMDVFNQTKLNKAQVDNMRIEGKYIAGKYLAEIENMKENTRDTRLRRGLDTITQSINNEFTKTQMDNTNMDTKYKELMIQGQAIQNAQQNEYLKSLPETLQLQSQKAVAEIAVLKEQKHLTRKQVESEVHKAANLIIQNNGLVQDQQIKVDDYKVNRGILEMNLLKSIMNFGPDGLMGVGNLYLTAKNLNTGEAKRVFDNYTK